MGSAPHDHGEFTEPHEALLDATRRLLHAHGAEDVRSTTVGLATAMGASIVDDVALDPDALPFDLSFGVGSPAFPVAPPDTDVRRCIEAHLPSFLVDAARAVELATRTELLAEAAAIDPVTGLANRSMLDRALRRLRPDDTIVMIDLDRLERVHDEHDLVDLPNQDAIGEDTESGEDVLRVFGRVLRSTSRGRDVIGRYEREEFVAVLSAGGNATAFLRRLLDEWSEHRPAPISFSAGIARSDGDADSTLAQVTHAISLAREAGRGRWMWVPGGMVPSELGAGPQTEDGGVPG